MATLDKIKLSGTTYDIIDSTAIHSLDGYWNSGQTESAITAATGALAESIAEQGYQTSGDVQNAISGKADTSAVTESIEAAVSGKADSSAITGFFGAVEYDSNSKHINFYHESTTGAVLAYVDATDFIKDGMVDNVEIKDVTLSGETVTCLVITFNTDAGKEEIDIPISQIFDASNYYTKSETDNAISAATSGKAETSALTAVNDVLTAHTANTDVHVTTSDKSTWSGKQDALVSGTNIKTINGNSILGSGDITVQTLPTVSGTTLIFS